MAPNIAQVAPKVFKIKMRDAPFCHLARCTLHVARSIRSQAPFWLILDRFWHHFGWICRQFWYKCSWIWDANLQSVEIASHKTHCQEPAKNQQRTRQTNELLDTPTSKLQFAERRQPHTKRNPQNGTHQNWGAAVSRRMASSIIN